MATRLSRLMLAFLAAAALSACTSTPAKPQLGKVNGSLTLGVGLVALPTRGTVTFEPSVNGTGIVMSSPEVVYVSASGQFKTALAPGLWVATGRSPKFGSGKYLCGPTTFRIHAGETNKVTVWCSGKGTD